MIKKVYFLPLFLLTFSIVFLSCNKDDDNNSIDQEWKTLNETRFKEISTNTETYTQLISQSGNGSVYWRNADPDNDSDVNIRITTAGNPEFTDTVVVRYEGWYFDKEGVKVIFDSTENPSERSKIAYATGVSSTPYPNKQDISFALSGTSAVQSPIAQCNGVSTLLQDMKTGENRIVCIPQELGYGASGSAYTPVSTSYSLIPAYTTIWFSVKLVKIIPMNGLS